MNFIASTYLGMPAVLLPAYAPKDTNHRPTDRGGRLTTGEQEHRAGMLHGLRLLCRLLEPSERVIAIRPIGTRGGPWLLHQGSMIFVVLLSLAVWAAIWEAIALLFSDGLR
jgi:hypothetical protein